MTVCWLIAFPIFISIHVNASHLSTCSGMRLSITLFPDITENEKAMLLMIGGPAQLQSSNVWVRVVRTRLLCESLCKKFDDQTTAEEYFG